MTAAGIFVDLVELVKIWAIGQFEKSKKLSRNGQLTSEDVKVTVFWDRVSHVFQDPDYYDMTHHTENQSLIVFQSNFVNSSEYDQNVSFKTKRTSRSVCKVSVDIGYSIGNGFHLYLKIPEYILEANAGFERQLYLKTHKSNTFEKEVFWAADSQLKLLAHSEASVQLEAIEECVNVKFNMKSVIRGTVVVSITNLKDNNSLVTTLEGGIAEIVQRDERYQRNELPGFAVQGNTLLVETNGSCIFVFVFGQQIVITEKKLDSCFGLT